MEIIASNSSLSKQSLLQCKYGDVISSIDDRYGVPLFELEKANPGIRDFNALQPGTRVKIPHARLHPYVVEKKEIH